MPFQHGWTWATASARERGIWVRASFRGCLHGIPALCDLFELTESGARKILDGDEWRPEYQRSSVNVLET